MEVSEDYLTTIYPLYKIAIMIAKDYITSCFYNTLSHAKSN